MDINNYSDNDNSSLNEGKRRSRKLDIIKRMVKGYRKKKRAEKIEKLMNDEDHWKGLQQLLGNTHNKICSINTMRPFVYNFHRDPNLQRTKSEREILGI